MFTKLVFLKPSALFSPKRMSLVIIIRGKNSQVQTSLKLIFFFRLLYFGREVLPDLSLCLPENSNNLTICSNCCAKKAEKKSRTLFTELLIL